MSQQAVTLAQPETRHVSETVRIWRMFRRNRLALVGLAAATIICLAAIFAPYIAPYDYAEQNMRNTIAPPSTENWLGTDQWGRDILSRIIVGSRVSLSVGIVSVVILIIIGVAIGAVAGYNRHLDGPLMRFVDIMMSIPGFFLLLTIVALFGPSLFNTMLVIGLTSWMGTARLVRGQFLSLREKEFIEAAHCVGVPAWRVITHHLLPNTLAVIIVQATLFMSQAILIESSLSYLGLGAQPPTPSWGGMLFQGRDYMRQAPWGTLFPGLAIFITVMAFNLLGDGLRDALDPHMRGR
ncbi:MAG: ABC transporter permease [Anaerolineae bacterium]|jgi:peptide/nickel transport system permease protein